MVQELPPEPIAIIGMACRYPGDVDSPSAFWDLMISSRSGRSPAVPASRFNVSAHTHSNNLRPGSFSPAGGYFLSDDLTAFDPTLFGISPIEAFWLDPQQRKFLEVVYECFESAGKTLESVSGSQTGCFVGCFTNDYQQIIMREQDFRHNYAATGSDIGLISSRVSHVFNLNGPTCTINTACSSSVYALHNACNALHARDCDAAIVGGINLILTVDQHMNTAKLGVLSPTSTCRTFDRDADGYGRAEGVGALFVKRLEDALRDGDSIRAVIRSTAINSNGHVQGVGITCPSVEGQEKVIRTAYERAGLDPLETGYFECHGTGTPIGDPIEVEAVSRAMNKNRAEQDGPLLIGAVKTQIGHSEAASGIAAIIKATLIVETGLIPPTIGVENLNPNIKFDEWKVEVAREVTPWPARLTSKICRVSVNSFGYGGSNGHVIVEAFDTSKFNIHNNKPIINCKVGLKERFNYWGVLKGLGSIFQALKLISIPPSITNTLCPAPLPNFRSKYLLVFSAHCHDVLSKNIQQLERVLPKYNLLDIAYTLGLHRSRLSFGNYATVNSTLDLSSNISVAVQKRSGPQKLAFVFTGQGAQWLQMGIELVHEFPSFLATIRSLDVVLRELPDGPQWTLESVMSSSDGSNLWDINCPALAQPVNTALQIALIRLLTSWGTIPHAVVGHSSGEIAASYAAGFITSAEAITAAYYRGKVVSSSDRTGAMLAVGMGADDVQQYVENHGGRIVVACRNSPRSVTLSGDVDAIEAVKAVFDECKIFCKILKTGNKAYHSHHMKSHAESYIRLLQASEISLKRHRDTTGKKRSAAMFSSVTGQLVDYKLAEFGVAYWTENLIKPVLFDAALTALINSDIFTSSDIQLVELGPSSVLEGPIRDIISVHRKTESVFYASVLQRGKDAVVTALNLCGQLYTTGLPVDLQAVNSIEVLPAGKDEPITRITLGKFIPSLPRYQWQYSTRKLAEPRWSKEQRNHKYPRHDLLGRIIPGHSDHTPVWTNFLRLKDLPWLEHHMIGSKVIFPAAGYICMAIEAIRQIQPSVTGELELSSFTIKDLSIHAALVIPEDANGVEIMFSSRVVKAEGSLVFHVRSYVQDKWYDHCDGTIRKNYKSLHAPVQSRKTAKAATELTKFPQRSSAKRWYSHFSTVGFDYGWTFQALQFVGTNPNTFDATANIDIVDRIKQDESRYALHPRTIDGCLQLMLIAMHGGRTKGFNSGYIPVKACEITIWESNLPEMFSEEVGNVTVWNDIRGHRAQQYSAQLVAPDNSLLMEISRMQFVRYETIVSLKKCSTLQRLAVRQPYSHMMWKPDVDLLSPNQAEMLLGSTGAGLENQLSYALKLLIHKYPNSKILILRNIPHAAMAAALEISNELPGKVIVASLSSSFAEALGDVLDTDTLAPGNFKLESLDSINLRGAKYEIVIAPSGTLETVSGLLAAGGRILSLKVDQCDFQSPHLKRIWELPHLSMEMASGDTVKEDILDMVMIYLGNQPQPPLLSVLKSQADALGRRTWSIKLGEDIPVERCHLFVLIEIQTPFLSTMERQESLVAIQTAIEKASKVTWVTGGGLLESCRPEYALASGLNHTITNEQASLNFATVDFNFETETCDRAARTLLKLPGGTDNEYTVKDGLVHISRLLPHVEANREHSKITNIKTVNVLFDREARLTGIVTAKKPMGSVTFHTTSKIMENVLPIGAIEICVAAVVINDGDVSVVNSSDIDPILVHEYSGTVSRTAQNSAFSVGDHVVGVVEGTSFDTHIVVSEKMCFRLDDNEDPNETVVSLVAHASAIYCLDDLGKISNDEIILITPDIGPAGNVLSYIARERGFSVFAPYSSPEEYAYLVECLQLPLTNIFSVDSEGLASWSLEMVPGCEAGFDVVVSRPASRFLAEALQNIAPMGRVVQIGSRKFSDSEDRSACGLCFDWRKMHRFKPRFLMRILRRGINEARRRRREGLPIGVSAEYFEVDDFLGAFRSFNYRSTSVPIVSFHRSIGKNLIVLNPESQIGLDPDACYFLVGCLSGLGQSLTNWMIGHGAKKFAFLQRSGTDNPRSAELISHIESCGISTLVIRGDVSNAEDVSQAVSQAREKLGPIRGVVHAAMVLRDGMFSTMSAENWKACIRPKVQGSLNLHTALLRDPLDFFIMTSSVSGVLGTAGQANYAAANTFLDYLARYRQSLGLPGTSLALPAVLGIGYLAQHAGIEDSLHRRGVYGIDEDELLEAFDMAVRLKVGGQLIVGLEAQKLACLKAEYLWASNPRFTHLLQPIKDISSLNPINFTHPSYSFKNSSITALSSFSASTSPSSQKGSKGSQLKVGLAQQVREARSKNEVVNKVAEIVARKLETLLMIKTGTVQPMMRMDRYGLDSMLGTELRNWCYTELGLDLPYLELVAMKPVSLAEVFCLSVSSDC